MLNEQELNALMTRADQSDVKAMIELADYYKSIDEVDKAFKYVHKSTLYNYPEGERKLGYYYEKGIGCTADPVKARQFYELAALHGDIKAKYNIGLFYYNNKQYPQALNLVKESADMGYGKACQLLAYIYEHGKVMEQDYEKAREYLLKACELGEKGIYHRLGHYSYEGLGTPKDLQEAFDYFYSGASEGETECYYYLGVMFAKGEGVNKDPSRAFYWYQQGANSGDPKAMYNLAVYYENGIGVHEDQDKALFWLNKSAEKGFGPAKKKLKANN